jgi:hypothetical protein
MHLRHHFAIQSTTTTAQHRKKVIQWCSGSNIPIMVAINAPGRGCCQWITGLHGPGTKQPLAEDIQRPLLSQNSGRSIIMKGNSNNNQSTTTTINNDNDNDSNNYSDEHDFESKDKECIE